jgi:hypothetical protein
MPAELFPQTAISELAANVNSRQLDVLRQAQKAGFIMNSSDMNPDTRSILDELSALGMLDVAFDGDIKDQPYLWTSNGNGQRVLRYLTGIRSGPHFEVAADTLAKWLEKQGQDQWWSVDGDPLLTGRLDFPCPGNELAIELMKIGKPLLVQARKEDATAKGQVITIEGLNEVVGTLADNLHSSRAGQLPGWSGDRILYCCWKGSTNDWLLSEDSEAGRWMAGDQAQARDTVSVRTV